MVGSAAGAGASAPVTGERLHVVLCSAMFVPLLEPAAVHRQQDCDRLLSLFCPGLHFGRVARGGSQHLFVVTAAAVSSVDTDTANQAIASHICER